MFLLKKLLFKFMELGLGLRTCFSLETKDPIFINFKLTEEEIDKVKRLLPSGFQLKPIRFTDDEDSASYWVSYNFYELKYPKPELSSIQKSRLEINTFVEDSSGREGIFVFCGSPFVSKESKKSPLGVICDFAEWLVTKIYGCGKLTSLTFQLSERLVVSLNERSQRIHVNLSVPDGDTESSVKLSSDYNRFNDISFFNQGKTCDYVNVNSSFYRAQFFRVPLEGPGTELSIECSLFQRKPDSILAHRGEIAYLVNSMNRCLSERAANG